MIDPSLISRLDADWAAHYPKRTRAPDKEAFLSMLDRELQERGFATERLTLKSVLTNRLLVTRCEQPEAIVMAHYDTPTTLPFWIAPLYTLFGHSRQISMSVALIVLILLPNILTSALSARFPSPAWGVALTLVYALLVLSLAPMLVPNPHNREDNTSGIIGLLALADWA